MFDGLQLSDITIKTGAFGAAEKLTISSNLTIGFFIM